MKKILTYFLTILALLSCKSEAEAASPVVKTGIEVLRDRGFEGLVGKIDGLVKMEININALDSSSGDLSMDSVFENEQALKDYQVHPLHKEIANGLVRPNVCERLSFDYEA